MPNAPAENTVSTSFTLPRELMKAIEAKAKAEMTNKSHLIRRALLNYLATEENTLRETSTATTTLPAAKKTSYRRRKKN
jgi:metal-responsive CopG/Arc/MetJ family transcriptional regulator